MQRQLMRDMARQQTAGSMEGHELKMRSMIDEAEAKRKAEEEEAANNNPLLGLFGNCTPSKKPNKMDKFANALRMSLASATGNDYDMR